MNLVKCNNVDDCVRYGEELELSHSKLFVKTPISIGDNKLIIANYTSIINPYMDYIKKTLVDYTISDEEMMEYKYKPKYFCLMKYGTMELWSLLLRVNNMKSIMDFKKKNIKVFNSQLIFDTINEIIILEDERIQSNNDEVRKKIIEMDTTTI